MKRCTACRQWKTIDGFFRDRTKPDGFHQHCKQCYKDRVRTRKPALERFWDRVDKSSDCWLWAGTKKNHSRYPDPNRRYGVMEFEGRQWEVHRLSYKLAHGDIPIGMLVCHKCDNPLCVNPDHLFLGTIQENNRDRHVKGRTQVGRQQASITNPERQSKKLTIDQVREIHKRFSQGEGSDVLGQEFGIQRSTVHRIATGKMWSSVTGLPDKTIRRSRK